MVRNIVGVQIALLEEKLKFKDVKDKLSNPEGNRLNYIAPAKALILWKVKY
jgi:tRNA U38,U39,U40 pseudouridine synthase TruA